MAELVLIDPFISLAGTDLSEHFKSVSLGPTVDTQDSALRSATSGRRWSLG